MCVSFFGHQKTNQKNCFERYFYDAKEVKEAKESSVVCK